MSGINRCDRLNVDIMCFWESAELIWLHGSELKAPEMNVANVYLTRQAADLSRRIFLIRVVSQRTRGVPVLHQSLQIS